MGGAGLEHSIVSECPWAALLQKLPRAQGIPGTASAHTPPLLTWKEVRGLPDPPVVHCARDLSSATFC